MSKIEEKFKTVKADTLLHKNMSDYAKDVVEDRALADFRDGLKPAARRVLWTANDLKATWANKTVKSARVTGDCMGKYHPHGDSGIYGSLVTMVNSEYPVIYGQGNFGNLVDGPAAARYTEVKISQLGMKMLECNDVGDYIPNYTGEFKEPVVIPTRFPNFFVNDCDGIAVGLKCSIPSHNLEEIVNAMKVVLKKGKDVKIKDIMKYLKGPDYKYGGKIISTPEEIASLYENGEGSIKYECDYTYEKDKKNYLLTITGYCPGFGPESFIKKMTDLIDDGVVIYVNDSSTKNDPCKLEVMIKNEEDFEKKIHKHLIISKFYRFYAIERVKSEDITKDVDTKVLVPNMLDLMKSWLEWRKDIETKMCLAEKAIFEDKCWKAYLRLAASKHLNVILEGLKSPDPITYISENLPSLKGTKRALEGAKYICDQRVISLQQIDQEKMKNDITDFRNRITELDNDINNIDQVVLRELDKLKPFYKERCLKV